MSAIRASPVFSEDAEMATTAVNNETITAYLLGMTSTSKRKTGETFALFGFMKCPKKMIDLAFSSPIKKSVAGSQILILLTLIRNDN